MRNLALSVLMLCACAKKDEPKPPAPSPSNPMTPTDAPSVDAPGGTQVVDVTAGELFEEYIANEIGADAKYLDKTLRVSGVVSRIAKDNGKPFVTFFVLEAPKNELRADFGSTDGLGTLKADQSIVARCRGGNVDHRPTLTECTFERVEPDVE